MGGLTRFRRRREVVVSALSGASPLLMLFVKEFGLVSVVMEEEIELCFMPRFPCVELRKLLLFVSLLAGESSDMLRSGTAGIMVIFPSAFIRFAPCLGVCKFLLELLKLFPGEGVFADKVSRLRRLGLGVICMLLVPLLPLIFKLASCSGEDGHKGDKGMPEEFSSCRSVLESRFCLLQPRLLPFSKLVLCSDESGQEVDGGAIPSSGSALEDRLCLLTFLLPTLVAGEGIPVEEDEWWPGVGLFRVVVILGPLLLLLRLLSSCESEAKGKAGDAGTLEGLGIDSFRLGLFLFVGVASSSSL